MPDQSDPIILYLIVNQSLEGSPNKVCQQVGNAVQYLLIHYFKAQIVKVKLHDAGFPKQEEAHINGMLSWLSNHSTKVIKKANDEDWRLIKREVNDLVLIKDAEMNETIIALWPQASSKIPSVVKNLLSL